MDVFERPLFCLPHYANYISMNMFLFKKSGWSWLVCLCWLEHCLPMHQKVEGSILLRVHAWVASLVLVVAHVGGDLSVFLSHMAVSLSLLSSL